MATLKMEPSLYSLSCCFYFKEHFKNSETPFAGQ